MSKETCILTTKDFTILEVMRDQGPGHYDALAPLLKRKIDAALVVFREDVPEDVATLSSRITFRVDGRDPDTRVLTHDRMASPVGLFLSITTLRGLALLGLAEGQGLRVPGRDGVEETIVLEKVHYQPEAARRQREPQPLQRRPTLKVIRGAFQDQPQSPAALVGADGFDDPGPSAA